MPGQPPALTYPEPHVAELRMRRPDSANRLEPADLAVIIAHCLAVEANPDVNVVLVTAEGRSFCAGFDLNALTAESDSNAGRHGGERAFEQAANALAALRPITIAVLDGAVIGGGTDIALACDLRIGSDRAKMQMPAAKIGVPLYASALQRYVSRLGLDVAKRLIFLAETIDAAEMKHIGMLTELVADGAADARARALATEIAALPPRPLAAMKAALNAATTGGATHPDMRAKLDAAYDPAEIARRVASLRVRQR